MIDIIRNPTGDVWQQLVMLAGEQCASLSLVWREGFQFDASADEITSQLQPFLIREEAASSWPGTELLNHTATVRRYRLDGSVLPILLRVPSLYAWLAPAYPEDLAFYTPEGDVWLGSIAHEKDAFFGEGGPKLSELQVRVPGLRVTLEE